ncbi:MAG: lysylphosphatidylglycerol synthase transmembrane domain-containing protein, partial [Stellaceae bacterium]
MKLRVMGQIVVGLACALFFLWLALHRVPSGAVVSTLRRADPVWLTAAILSYAVNLGVRARRWQIILRPVAAVPYPVVAKTLVVGYGLNVIMPARLGELFRAEFFKKTYGLARIWALTSIVIERLFDGLAVVTILGVGLLLASVTRTLSGVLVGVFLTAGAIFGAILLAALCFAGRTSSRLFARLPLRISTQLAMMQRGFQLLHSWRILEVVALTLIVYIPDSLSLWFAVKAVGLTLGFADTLILVGAASLSTLVPSGPAFLGTLQFAYALAIGYAGGTRAVGIAAATLVQLCLMVPVALVATSLL